MMESSTAICVYVIMEIIRYINLSESTSDMISCKTVLSFSITRLLKKHECLHLIELQKRRSHRRKKDFQECQSICKVILYQFLTVLYFVVQRLKKKSN